MKIGKGMLTGIGIASLLVALPAQAGGSKATGSSSAGASDSSSSSAGTGSSGSGSMGAGGSATGSSGAMGSPSTSGSSGGMASSSAGGHQIEGKVDKFDQSNKELTLSLKLSDSTQVTKDGQTATLSDIKEGDQVRASFSGSGESLEVTRIEVMSGAKSTGSGSGSMAPSTSPSSPSGSSGSSSSPSGSSGSPGSSSPGSSSGSSSGSSGRGY